METREQELQQWGLRSAGAEACWGVLWGAALHGTCGEEEQSPSRKAAYKLETTPQPHQSPPQAAGQASFCTTHVCSLSHCLQAPTLANLILSRCEAGAWLWQSIETALCQGPCSSQPCLLPTKLQTSSFRPEEIPTLLPISQPWLK